MFNEFNSLALLGLTCIALLLWVQSFIAALVKAKQPGAIPGMEPQEATQMSFVFRAYRTHANTMENAIPTLAAGFTCVLLKAAEGWMNALIWLFVFARIAHMVLYYKIATDKNPSPRSYFYLIGSLSTLGLIVLAIFSALK